VFYHAIVKNKQKEANMKRVVVFDLDETVVDSAHRVPNNPDGTLNLAKYLELKTYDSVMRDSLLPLVRTMKGLCRKENYIIICTARQMGKADWDFLELHGITAHKVLHRPEDGSENHKKDGPLKRAKLQRIKNLAQFRDLPWFMFDDAKPVITEMRKMGIVCLNAIKVNKRLEAF